MQRAEGDEQDHGRDEQADELADVGRPTCSKAKNRSPPASTRTGDAGSASTSASERLEVREVRRAELVDGGVLHPHQATRPSGLTPRRCSRAASRRPRAPPPGRSSTARSAAPRSRTCTAARRRERGGVVGERGVAVRGGDDHLGGHAGLAGAGRGDEVVGLLRVQSRARGRSPRSRGPKALDDPTTTSASTSHAPITTHGRRALTRPSRYRALREHRESSGRRRRRFVGERVDRRDARAPGRIGRGARSSPGRWIGAALVLSADTPGAGSLGWRRDHRRRCAACGPSPGPPTRRCASGATGCSLALVAHRVRRRESSSGRTSRGDRWVCSRSLVLAVRAALAGARSRWRWWPSAFGVTIVVDIVATRRRGHRVREPVLDGASCSCWSTRSSGGAPGARSAWGSLIALAAADGGI